MAVDTISILDGSTFVVSDRRGDIDAGPGQPHGLFFRDMRFLSRWILRLHGSPLELLSTDDVDYFSAQFFLLPADGHHLQESRDVRDKAALGRRRCPRGPHRSQDPPYGSSCGIDPAPP